MPVPYIHSHPVLRPGFIFAASWLGSPEDMALQCSYYDASGNPASISFQTQGDNPGEICLPTSKTINDLDETTMMAHLRMNSLLSETVPGSKEWELAILDQATPRFQTAIGNCEVISVTPFSDTHIDILMRKVGANGITRTFRVAYTDLNKDNYQFIPQTQLKVIAGFVKTNFSNYVHNYPTTQLTSTQKSDIVNAILARSFWV